MYLWKSIKELVKSLYDVNFRSPEPGEKAEGMAIDAEQVVGIPEQKQNLIVICSLREKSIEVT